MREMIARKTVHHTHAHTIFQPALSSYHHHRVSAWCLNGLEFYGAHLSLSFILLSSLLHFINHSITYFCFFSWMVRNHYLSVGRGCLCDPQAIDVQQNLVICVGYYQQLIELPDKFYHFLIISSSLRRVKTVQ